MPEEIRCPMCSHKNPAGAENCQVCGARLSPLGAPSAEPDWLSDIRGSSAAEGASAAAGDDLPDWLSGAGAQDGGEDPLSRLSGGAAPVENADWLEAFKSETPAPAEPPASAEPPVTGEPLSADEEADLSQWLSNMKGQAAPGAAQPPAAEFSAETELPAWLSELSDTQPAEPPGPPLTASEPAAAEPDALPDWLKELSADPGASLDATPDESANAAPPEETVLPARGGFTDILRGFNESIAAPETENPPLSEPAAEAPDWLSQFAGPQAPAELPPAASQPSTEEPAGAELPDWLNELAAEPPLSSSVNEEPAAAESPAWLNAFASPEEPALPPAAEPAAETPDWLSGLTSLEAEAGPLPPAEAPAAAEPDAPVSPPDWLSGFSSEAAAAPLAVDPGASAEIPSWLSDFQAESSGTPTTEPSTLDSGAAPDWLNDLQAETPAAPASPEPAPTGELPSWLSGFAAAVPAADSAAEAAEPAAWLSSFEADAPAEAAGLPNWLSSTGEEQPAADLPAESGESRPDLAALFAEERPAEMPNIFNDLPAAPPAPPAVLEEPAAALPAAEAETPDWLTAFNEAGKDNQIELDEGGSLPFVDESVPAWLNGARTPAEPSGPPALIDTPEPQLEAGSAEPFQVELPDWLNEQPDAQAQSAVAESESEEGAGLVRAELPVWVEDLRPIESILPGEAVVAAAANADSGREEKLGPLAGMRGVLPGEELAVRFRKLPTYSARLRVSERQRAHATLLQNVLDMESIPKEIPALRSQAPQYLYRLLIAVVLIVALLAGMIFTDLKIFPVPQAATGDVGLNRLYAQIEALPGGAPVLLAVDYEAGLSGEMTLAASSVVEHLMQRSARLAIVSTVPSGPLLAQDLLRTVQPRTGAYDLATQSANLGYLPGGTTSLLEFARRPSVAAPLAFDGGEVWGGPALAGIQDIQSFALVLVLTDSLETGRAWVEQVQPLLGSTPLSMVSSAQAGPMLLPYLEAGQITGLVNGFLGGAMYEQRSGRVNLANAYWNSYQSGYLAGILMLILGGIISAVVSTARKPRRPRA